MRLTTIGQKQPPTYMSMFPNNDNWMLSDQATITLPKLWIVVIMLNRIIIVVIRLCLIINVIKIHKDARNVAKYKPTTMVKL